MLSHRQPGTFRLTTNGLLIAAVLFTLSVIMAPYRALRLAPYIRIQTYLLTENLRPAFGPVTSNPFI